MPYSWPAERVSNHDGGGGLDIGITHFFFKKVTRSSSPTRDFTWLPGQIVSIRAVLAVLLRLEFISVKNLSKKAPAGHVRMVQIRVFP